MNAIIKAFRAWWNDEKRGFIAPGPMNARAWMIEDYIEQAYHQGREDAVRDMQAHMADMTADRLAVDQAIRLSKANKREVA